MKKFLLTIVFFTTLSTVSQNKIIYSDVAQDLLENIIAKKSYEKQVKILAESTLEDLTSELKTDTQKLAFWLNVYNGFIQISLMDNPKEYEDRGAFFKKPRVKIAGEILSFDDIEHDIMRKSRVKISWGYLRKYFRPKWERKLRIDGDLEWRIHFALNCGAKSCPPVAIYSAENLNSELDFMTTKYLNEQTTYNSETKTATSVSLFSWFRADFGGLCGARQILADYKITPEKPKKLAFKNYDWTLSLGNFRTIPN
ncbi:DUF547 domain-containing protein [Polaribacter sp. MED152]|uniref:DUF547 domain-containing protein n=1 Tax=Polaribacter sp. MED152 TaxID=313598 RepID=UPI000068C73E|nr:DUF547 domain-containing protein [Polaribacter sp. MED152]EAQ42788.1 protein of unknown function, DUF547 [Polaribacter sp. MED152]